MFATTCDWKISEMGWMFTLFFLFLGIAAAVWGGWLERAGPRKAGFVAAVCWCGGLLIGAFAIYIHQLWLLWLGSGVIGGVGLGLGYISPVSTLIKWFPDRRGMATGMAIMGFGGGAMIGSPLANLLMKHFATPTSVGVWQTFVTLAVIYFVFMVSGAFGYRIPATGWKPAGWTPPANTAKAMITTRHVHVNVAPKTPQFWLIWGVLCLNVTAGIGIIGMASPMLQEVFAGKLIGVAATFNELTVAQKASIAAIAAGFTGLLSLFNIGGRFFWASLSDHMGRKNTYYTFFVLGIILYASAPWSGRRVTSRSSSALLHHPVDVRRRLLDGARVPGRRVRHADGRRHPRPAAHRVVGGGHLRPGDRQLHARVPARPRRAARAGVRHHRLHPVRPARHRLHLQLARQAGSRQVLHDGCRARGGTQARARSLGGSDTSGRSATVTPSNPALVYGFWLLVGIPIAWGVYKTLGSAWVLFSH